MHCHATVNYKETVYQPVQVSFEGRFITYCCSCSPKGQVIALISSNELLVSNSFEDLWFTCKHQTYLTARNLQGINTLKLKL